MTALALRRSEVGRPLIAALGLVAAVGLRWAVATSTRIDPVVVGLLFGAALLLLARSTGWRDTSIGARSLALGLAGGFVLVAVTTVDRLLTGAAARAGAVSSTFPFAPWAIATCLVAAGEEAILRGVLFDAISERFGGASAVLVTSVAFALMHVPLYGWQAVPLDLGVGLWFAGLRLMTGGIAAPAIAHAVADLATYWL